MPVETRISEEFGDQIRVLIGTDTYGKASIKTGISQAYLLAMVRGKVPSRAIVERFAKGYSVDSAPLLVTAGYEKAADPVERCVIELRELGDVSDEVRQLIQEAANRIVAEREQREKSEAQ